MSHSTQHRSLAAGVLGAAILVFLVIAVAGKIPHSGKSQGDIGRSLPSFHCADNPQIEDCEMDQSAVSDISSWAALPYALVSIAAVVAALLSLLVHSAIQQILSEPDPAERRKRFFELTVRGLSVATPVFVAIIVIYFRLIGG